MSRDQVFVQSKQQKHKENVLDQLKGRSRRKRRHVLNSDFGYT